MMKPEEPAQSPAGVPPELTADREELLGDAIRALIAGRIKCSDDLPPEQRPIYASPVEAGWVAMKDRKPKANQVVCVYWPPNLKDGSHVVDVVEWGVHDCARLLLTGYNHCHSQFATYWIPLPTP